MDKTQKIIIVVLFIIGVWIPFTLLCFFELFLLIPFGLVLAFSLLWLIVTLFTKSIHVRDALFFFLIVPVFVFSQVLSVIVVDNIQLFRSERIIDDLELLKQKKGSFPNQYDVSFGIDYSFDPNDGDFSLSYSRGFLVTENYNSETGIWVSQGFD